MIMEYLIKILQRDAFKWLVLVIDLVFVSTSFILSYYVYNLTLDFDVNKILVQLPIIALVTLIAFLITGSYKGIGQNTGIRNVNAIFNAICLSSILVIFLVLGNSVFQIENSFTITFIHHHCTKFS
ncbi:MAG: hypothetical protein JKX82_00510 [Oleispira sp.]|nr:hypothetical protein [Oleispira sp.]